MRSTNLKQGLSLLLSLGYCTLSQGIFFQTATAQVTPDGTTNTTVDVSGSDFTINQGDRAGGNLFHSFGEFSVPTNGSAFFNNAADIVNIFSRVTGGNISNIDGLLGANGAANLFLINPAGIIFGENARLDIGGSFYGSTADSILFEDGTIFSATDTQAQPILTINAPIGLNFRDNPRDIVNQSVAQNSAGEVVGLEVLPGRNLSLIGGDINFETGNATASGGNIELGGLLASGTVGINDDGSLSFPEDVAKTNITLNNAATVDVRSTSGAGKAGKLTITANSLNLDQGTLTAATASGSGGNITIQTQNNITMRNESLITAAAIENGDGGDININGQFIVAFPSQPPENGNDILANSVEGREGIVRLNSTFRLNIQPRKAIEGNGTNDIDPIETEFAVDIVESKKYIEILTDEQLIGNLACAASSSTDKEANSFIIVGKGGIPPQPTEPFMTDSLIPDDETITSEKKTVEREIEQKQRNPNYITAEIKPIKTSMGDIYPARGIIKTEDGKIILTSYSTDNINTRTPHNSANCTHS